ncbi:MAG: arylsulfatase A-like enzyme [Planctomycetota bacterium]|jgi:arylsulfatase A-like enzyme
MTPPFTRWTLPLALVAASCGGSGPERPNVLLITMDTTRPDYLGTYGQRQTSTPALDNLAAEGTRFDHAMSASAVTPVSHATILTGEFPYTHGLRVLSAKGGFSLPREHASVASTLKEEGYRTGAVHSAFPVSRFFGFEHGFDTFKDMNGSMEDRPNNTTGWDTHGLQRRSDQTTDLALEFLEDGDEPFFLWIHYWDPHDPILRPPIEWMPQGEPRNDTERLTWGDKVYAAEVRYMDSQIGRLFEGMKTLGMYEDTTIVVTSDHGEGLSDGDRDHQWRSHRMVYEEQIHVPLIVRTPGPSGRQEKAVPELVRTADIVPTILDYSGVSSPRELDGRSLRALLEGNPDELRIGYADQINGYDTNAKMVVRRPDAKFLFCVADGRWKLTYRPHDPVKSELFDLQTDPAELDNLLPKGTHTEKVHELMFELAKRNPWVLQPFPDEGANTEGMGASLENLGYAEGSVSDIDWSWVCPRHPETLRPERDRCPECEGIPVLIRAK